MSGSVAPLEIRALDPASPDARRFLEWSDAYLASLYPAESNHLEDVEALSQPNVHFVGGYEGSELRACGAVKLLEDDGRYGEVKRVFVPDSQRGRGYSKQVMRHLEEFLLASGVCTARLETGIRQVEALSLYRGLGYRDRGPFGAYRPDPLSVFLEKDLAP